MANLQPVLILAANPDIRVLLAYVNRRCGFDADTVLNAIGYCPTTRGTRP
jgi:hypothetical protein